MKAWVKIMIPFLMCGALACTKGPKSLTVRKVLIDFGPGFTKVAGVPKRDQIRQIAIEALKGEPKVRFSEKADTGALLRVRLEPATDFALENEQSGEEILVGIRLSVDSAKGVQQYYWGVTLDMAQTINPKESLQEALDECLKQVLSAYFAEGESTKALLLRLEHYSQGRPVDKNKVLLAIQVLGSRREKSATKLLSKLLLNSKEPVNMAALGALTLIADPSAIDAVTTFAEKKPNYIRKQAILAAREMGGEKAAAWLFTMSTGYDDPDVQKAAEDALNDVESRLKKPQ